ncbi:MAG: hypothetical protein K2H87_06880, partial [Duncaniella sp.]|nr:hypothetical protein [Duncaniella sp.]
PGYTVSNNNTSAPSDASTNDQESVTPAPDNTNSGTFEPTGEVHDHADFDYSSLPYGRYKIYAVANYPELTDAQCETEETLKSLSFAWNTDVRQDNKMFGYFTRSDDQASTGFDAPIILVNSKRLDIHAWIKRQVSKVTIAFDPSELKEAVTVYIKSVTIHDIPASCYLGQNNTPDKLDQLIADGETINYYTSGGADDYTKWLRLQKGTGRRGSDHSNNSEALYFFENMQGNYPGQKDYLKEQIPDETGTSIDNPDTGDKEHYTNDFKDRIPYGTYIEVIAYYVSKNTEKMSSGNIKYRFMLGKDIKYNYDAQRNYHYKLTLKLRGFANEADWHISYTEPTPSLYTPDQYYISYLYGQDINFPVRVVTGDPNNLSNYIICAE